MLYSRFWDYLNVFSHPILPDLDENIRRIPRRLMHGSKNAAKSLLLAVMLLQRTDYGLLPRSYNASNLPIGHHDWPVIDRFMRELGIHWRNGADLTLHVTGK